MKPADDDTGTTKEQIQNCLDYYKIRIRRRARDPRFVLECAGFIVLAVYAGYTIGMYYANRDSADAARSSAGTATQTLNASKEQFRLENRPYVWLVPGLVIQAGPKIPPGEGDLPWLKAHHVPLVVSMRADNGGHSPAINTEVSEPKLFFDSPDKARQSVLDYAFPYRSGNDIAPNTWLYSQSPPPFDVTDELMDDLQNHRKVIYFVARIRYRDMFNPKLDTPYETAFCAMISPIGMPFVGCDISDRESWTK